MMAKGCDSVAPGDAACTQKASRPERTTTMPLRAVPSTKATRLLPPHRFCHQGGRQAVKSASDWRAWGVVGVEACYLDELEAEDDGNTDETQQQVTKLCVSNVVY